MSSQVKSFILITSIGTRLAKAADARSAAKTFIDVFGIKPDMVYETKRIESVKALRDFDTMVSQ